VIAEEQGRQFLELVPPPQRAQVIALIAAVLGESVTEEAVVRWLDHGQDRAASRCWVIDPIDGTKGFIARRHYAIAVGIVEDGQPTGGLMSAPGYGDGAGALFYALENIAYQQPLNGGTAQTIHVSDRRDPAMVRTVQSVEKAHSSKSRIQRVRAGAGLGQSPVAELDSMEKYALVANGDADVYLRLPRAGSTYAHNAWDHAAGVALVLAAGGMATDVDGSPLDFSQGRTLPNKGMVVTNGTIHDRVLAAVQAVLGDE
jgi:3'(2'), 5'-bisphosphate nucleotidase